MDIALKTLTLVLTNLPQLIAAGKDMTVLINNAINAIKGKTTLTPEARAAMVALNTALEDEILKPLPDGP